ncbi:MAG: sigma-70 family RNA polymerase sigma factor [Zetaproteobacteria bacterium]|nr:MAG: sigma-70 family RNA polymerase sigma factor [Zetaproteobacteria bacterium]
MEREDPARWLDAYGDDLYRYALARVRDPDQAADLVQETLLAAWQARAQFSGRSSVRTWLIGILKHKIVDHIRREIRTRQRNDALERDPTSRWFDDSGRWVEHPQPWRDDPARLLENREFLRALRMCLERLPERQRRAFELREVAGDAPEEICQAMGITPTNLNVLIYRARLALRKCLELHWFGGRKR